MRAVLAALAGALLLAGCGEETTEMPPPVALTEEALGFFCQMDVLEHEGPKAQIHLAGYPMPLWFAQVRDGIAYIKAGERVADITAIYVSDMGAAATWADPGAENWIDAGAAHFVVGSDAVGGMGAPELVPFATAAAAKGFADRRGGRVLTLDQIDPAEVLAPVEIGALPDTAG